MATKRTPWFDGKTDESLIDDYAQKLDSFTKAMEDGRVDARELQAQERRVVELMREIEPELSDAVHDKVTRLLCEITAFDMMSMAFALEQGRPKTKFRG